MKKIITTVGTSLFSNLMQDREHSNIEDDYKYLENVPHQDWKNSRLQRRVGQLKANIREAVLLNKDKDDSAEIKSILAIVSDLKEEVEVYLLATDTVLSRLACELVREWFEDYKGEYAIKVLFNEEQNVINGLQVTDKAQFEQEGLINLINRLYAICNHYFADTVLNITGGYKAILPYMTIFGQVNKIPVKYIFEETDTLIEIPLLPLTVDTGIFEKYPEEFFLLEGEILNKSDYHQFATEANSCLEIDVSGEIMLNSLGWVLWEKYKFNYFFFYASDEVWNAIQTQEDIKRILTTKFYTQAGRQNKTEIKQNHYVYDDGNNNNRFYYFEVDDKVYIYKTFESEPKAKAFIKIEFDKQDEIGKSKLRQIEIQQD